MAIKVLPTGLTSDPDRLQRFEREAKAAGSLNHPHVLAVYDVGRHDGSPYVVSELLEGQTLRERLGGGPLPARKAVEIGVQIARGLAAAHDKGIVHRPDIDRHRMAFYGLSWGGDRAPLALAVEDRFAAAVLVVGGLDPWTRPRPEVDRYNYAPRVTLPVLMMNGRYDLLAPLESSARPMFDLLGTPPAHKVRLYESDHSIPRSELIRESLQWLDRYLGPVEAKGALQTPR